MKFHEIIFSPHNFSEKHSAWIEHSPFAFFLIEKIQPQVFVELGTHWGVSYFAFCQAINNLNIKAKAYAVDLFYGDEHSGFYDQEVFDYVSKINEEHFSHFSNILQSSFDEANQFFENGSIDLLHIDGLHTYEAVKHDFELWLPKMSEKGVVVFHDTAIKVSDFGVWRLMDELKRRFPYFEFSHGYGLGIVCTGRNVNTGFLEFVKKAGNDVFIQKLFENIGRKTWLEQQYAGNKNNTQHSDTEESVRYLNQLNNARLETEAKAREIEHLKLLLAQITTSPSWKLTAPLRYIKSMIKSGNIFLLPKIKLIEKSELFDAPYYLQNNKDVRESGMNPARHYLLHGGFEGRNPSAEFDSAFYLEQNPDAAASGINPLLHYIKYGNQQP